MATKLMEKLDKRVALIGLGCDKNMVDAEHMLYLIKENGFTITDELCEAQVIIINTCGFIKDAQMESIQKILEIEKLKQQKLEKLIVTGCLSQRNAEDLKKDIPLVDYWAKINEDNNIVNVIYKLYNQNFITCCPIDNLQRIVSTPKHYAYVKIAEGCDNFCSYCTIPKIRGRYKSRTIDEIINECEVLVKNGTKEIIIIAQDITKYGEDLYGENKLIELLKKITKIDGLVWVRLHYCYPELISEELIDLIDKNEKICKYIDIPFQHVSTKLLKLMNRKSDYNSICKLIEYIKSKPSNIAIRSSFILGFPKETNKDYLEVITFLKKYKLNNVGFFKYSREEGTLASKYSRQVNELVKKLRVKKAYKVQNKIAYANNKKLIGETVLAVCEGFNENNGVFILRNQYNSPNIDTAMFDYSDELKIGEFYNVTVSGFCGLDLICEIVKGEKL